MAAQGISRTLRDSLEDFSARALAADGGDKAAVAQLRGSLDLMLKSIEPGSPAADLLNLGLSALTAIEDGKLPDAPATLDAVAAASAAIITDSEGPQNLQSAAASLNALLRPAGPLGLPGRGALGEAPSNDAPSAPEYGAMACGLASDQAANDGNASAMAPDAAKALVGDPELMKDFVAESCDRIAEAEAALLALEADSRNKEQINAVLRAFHTIKGAAGFLGLEKIQEVSHLAESLLIEAREGSLEMSGGNADLALKSCDALRSMVQAAAGGHPAEMGRIAELLERLRIGAASRASNLLLAERQPESRKPVGWVERSDDPPSGQKGGSSACGLDPAYSTPTVTSDVSPLSKSVSDGVRVSAERLDELVNMVGELVVNQTIVAQATKEAGEVDGRLARSVAQASKILRSLQDLTLGLRMVPLRATFGRMTRLVRDLARKSGKNVQFISSGEDTEIDRNMVEVLTDPLVHLLRNAVDHGIESEPERLQRGKAPAGTIRLSASHAGGSVVIEIRDDGRGLDRRAILSQAVAGGWVEAKGEVSEADLCSLIFLPGLSTAKAVTDVSGRGVGMDVVKKNVDLLRGKIDVQSAEGRGCAFTLRLPLTLAIADAMLVRAGSERYLLPTTSIDHSFRPAAGAVSTVVGRGEMVMVRGQLLPVFRLHRLFGIQGAVEEASKALLILIEGGGRRCALMVDELLGQQQVVIKSLGKTFAAVPGVSGGAILGDGRAGLILDASGLVQLAHSVPHGNYT